MRTTKPTPAAIQRALADMAVMAAPTAGERAEQRMRNAKALFTAAAEAALAGDPEAPDRCTAALQELRAAQRQLETARQAATH